MFEGKRLVFKRRDKRPIWRTVVESIWPRGGWGRALRYMHHRVVGNPLTFPIIAAVNLKLGQWILGRGSTYGADAGLREAFAGAARDLKHNFYAIFTSDEANWQHLSNFYHEVMVPYFVGGLIPGMLTSLAFYYLSLPVITAYQNRRNGAEDG